MSTQEIPEERAAAGFEATATPDVLTARTGSLARIMLNRPKAINALTTDMVVAVNSALDAWRDDESITAVTIEGAGERGLCAGGDVRSVRESFLVGDHASAFEFFTAEYRMNAAIADYPKLIVSHQDGIVMGGGVGISAYAGLRVATPRTKVAMPETIIGFFPDVGALYLLSRAPGGTGAHLALTGTTVGGHDSCYIGLSDVVVDADAWPTILERLAAGASRDEAVADLVQTGVAPIEAARAWIDDAYGSGENLRTPSDVLAHLRASDDESAREAAELLAQRSPLSVAATLEALRRAARMRSVHEVLEQDMRLARGLVEHGDFAEGVRAQLVDKDRTPRWSQTSFDDVTDEQVARLFV